MAKLPVGHKSSMHPDLPEKPGGPDNWVEAVGGLPDFIKRVAKHIFYDSGPMTVTQAVKDAVSQVEKWAAKGNPKAIAAVAEWKAKRGLSKAKTGVKKAATHDNEDLSAAEIFDLALLSRAPKGKGAFSVAGNAPSGLGTGVRGSAFDEAKHPRQAGGKFGAKISSVDLLAAKRKITGGLTNLQVGQNFTLPNNVGWVKRGPLGYFIQGNGGFTASVRTLSEAIEAAAALLVKKGS